MRMYSREVYTWKYTEKKSIDSLHRKLILLALRTLQFAGQRPIANDSKTHDQRMCHGLPSLTSPSYFEGAKNSHSRTSSRKARRYREDPGVRETRVSAPYSPACALLFCRPKICEGHKNVRLYNDDIIKSSRTCAVADDGKTPGLAVSRFSFLSSGERCAPKSVLI